MTKPSTITFKVEGDPCFERVSISLSMIRNDPKGAHEDRGDFGVDRNLGLRYKMPAESTSL